MKRSRMKVGDLVDVNVKGRVFVARIRDVPPAPARIVVEPIDGRIHLPRGRGDRHHLRLPAAAMSSWYEVPIGERGEGGFVQVLADSPEHARQRAQEQLDDVGITPANPDLHAAWRRMVAFATRPRNERRPPR